MVPGSRYIFKLSAAGREQVLAVEGPGSSFAELPAFDGDNYPASASALENAGVPFISRKNFQDFCREHPDLALKVLAVVGSRLRRLIGIIEDLSFTTVLLAGNVPSFIYSLHLDMSKEDASLIPRDSKPHRKQMHSSKLCQNAQSRHLLLMTRYRAGASWSEPLN